MKPKVTLIGGASAAAAGVPAMRARKKARRARARLTHFEIRRDGRLRLRLAIADDAIAGAGRELGALIQKMAPGTASHVTVPGPLPVVFEDAPPQHAADDAEYHADLHEQLIELFGSLCDSALDDALEIARREQAQRLVGSN